jgi:hypothetical protein
MHSHRDYFKAHLDWFVEIGTTHFYDMHIVQTRGKLNGSSYDPTITEILLLGLDHNKFTIDQCRC